ncbi:hypothetical protein AB4298_07470 [Shewanella sp. 10N.261.52.F9]|uniref:hypothetical protein n=1 Tax=Shewanella sp. 10N.261.52.F9 TaxID=3229684 RepID=UPI00354F2272
MAKLNLSQAARITGKNRTTIWRHIKSGKLSCQKDRDGMPTVDTSELIRVYGTLRLEATPNEDKKQHQATPSYDDLVEVIKALRDEQKLMRDELNKLTHRLTFSEPKEDIPENDPDWPETIKTIEDITLRTQIRAKYSN